MRSTGYFDNTGDRQVRQNWCMMFRKVTGSYSVCPHGEVSSAFPDTCCSCFFFLSGDSFPNPLLFPFKGVPSLLVLFKLRGSIKPDQCGDALIIIREVCAFLQLPFASIPLIFAVQQFIEGLLWLSLEGNLAVNSEWLAYCFLFFAQVLWPVWIPVAFLFLEKDGTRRLFLKILTGVGLIVGGYLAWCLLNYQVGVEIAGHHIRYIPDFPKRLAGYGSLFYGIATVLPSFVSGVRGTKVFGVLILISYLVSALYFRDVLISVWCYFAAVISLAIYFLIPSEIWHLIIPGSAVLCKSAEKGFNSENTCSAGRCITRIN